MLIHPIDVPLMSVKLHAMLRLIIVGICIIMCIEIFRPVTYLFSVCFEYYFCFVFVFVFNFLFLFIYFICVMFLPTYFVKLTLHISNMAEIMLKMTISSKCS